MDIVAECGYSQECEHSQEYPPNSFENFVELLQIIYEEDEPQ